MSTLYDVKNKGKWGARAALALIPIGILIGLAFVPVTMDGSLWPIGHHTTVTIMILVLLAYGAIALGLIVGFVIGVTWLWEKADW